MGYPSPHFPRLPTAKEVDPSCPLWVLRASQETPCSGLPCSLCSRQSLRSSVATSPALLVAGQGGCSCHEPSFQAAIQQGLSPEVFGVEGGRGHRCSATAIHGGVAEVLALSVEVHGFEGSAWCVTPCPDRQHEDLPLLGDLWSRWGQRGRRAACPVPGSPSASTAPTTQALSPVGAYAACGVLWWR